VVTSSPTTVRADATGLRARRSDRVFSAAYTYRMVPHPDVVPPELKARVERLRPVWGLVGDVVLHRAKDGQRSWVAFVQRTDGPAFLKFSELRPELPEMAHEANALAHWNGQGAARLLDKQGGDAFLLELCACPTGLDLPRLAALQKRIHVPAPPPFLSLEERAKGEWSRKPGVRDAAMVAQAALVTKWLVDDEPARQAVLLHGDFHGGNVLESASRELVVIDPMPLAGDPAYDLAQMVGNSCRDQPFAAEAIVRTYSRSFGFDAARVAGWALVKAVGTGNWRGYPYVARGLHSAYEAARAGRI
jgi:streptomycin 6-kinase